MCTLGARQRRGQVLALTFSFPLPAVWTGVSAGRAALSLARRDTHCICVHTASPAESEQTPWADCLSSFSCPRPLKRTGPGEYPCCLHPQSHCQMLQPGLRKDKAPVTDFHLQGHSSELICLHYSLSLCFSASLRQGLHRKAWRSRQTTPATQPMNSQSLSCCSQLR